MPNNDTSYLDSDLNSANILSYHDDFTLTQNNGDDWNFSIFSPKPSLSRQLSDISLSHDNDKKKKYGNNNNNNEMFMDNNFLI